MVSFLGGAAGWSEAEEAEVEKKRLELLNLEELERARAALERQVADGELRPRDAASMRTVWDFRIREVLSKIRRYKGSAAANRPKEFELEVLRRAVRIYDGPVKWSWTQVAAKVLEESHGREHAAALEVYGGPDQAETGDPGERLRKRVERARKAGHLPPVRRR
jgi:hypothetical protein